MSLHYTESDIVALILSDVERTSDQKNGKKDAPMSLHQFEHGQPMTMAYTNHSEYFTSAVKFYAPPLMKKFGDENFNHDCENNNNKQKESVHDLIERIFDDLESSSDEENEKKVVPMILQRFEQGELMPLADYNIDVASSQPSILHWLDNCRQPLCEQGQCMPVANTNNSEYSTSLDKFYVPPLITKFDETFHYSKIAEENVTGYMQSQNPYVLKRGTRCNNIYVEHIVGLGNELNMPNGFTIGWNNEFLIADTENNRIVVVNRHGYSVPNIINGIYNLCKPRKVAVSSDCFYVTDQDVDRRIRLQRFSKNAYFSHEIIINDIAIICSMLIDCNENLHLLEALKNRIHIVQKGTRFIVKSLNLSEYVIQASDFVIYNERYFVSDFRVSSIFSIFTSNYVVY